jgi:hypothetical protein
VFAGLAWVEMALFFVGMRGLFDLDEFHGFPEVVKYVHAFLGYLVKGVSALFLCLDEFLRHHGVEDFHKGLPAQVCAVHNAGGFVGALPYGL